VKKIKKIGNLKFSESTFGSNKSINLGLRKFLDNKKYWCAASTHEGEEVIAANVHINLQKKIKNLVTIIIPRNIQRTQTIINMFLQLGLKIHVHSNGKKIPKNTQIYIVDTYGESKTFFKINKVVFLGKSLTVQGGQNPLEPARFNCNILHGPNVSNFYEIYKLLDENKISFKINNQNQLTKKIKELLKKDIRSKNIDRKIKIIGEKILRETLIELKKFI
jgi:3-deoxy-D-manno-octulosonic-acid transferase